MNRQKLKYSILGCIVLLFLIIEPAYANRLAEAAKSAETDIYEIGQAGAAIGVGVGAVLMFLSFAHIGKTILVGSLTGLSIFFGAPGIIEIIRSWFS